MRFCITFLCLIGFFITLSSEKICASPIPYVHNSMMHSTVHTEIIDELDLDSLDTFTANEDIYSDIMMNNYG